MKRIIFALTLFTLMSSSAFSQNFQNGNSSLFLPFWDFYSVNYLSSKAAGRGYTGIAGDNDISGTIFNPASLELKDKFQVYGEYVFKSNLSAEPNIYFDLKELHPVMLAGFGFKNK